MHVMHLENSILAGPDSEFARSSRPLHERVDTMRFSWSTSDGMLTLCSERVSNLVTCWGAGVIGKFC